MSDELAQLRAENARLREECEQLRQRKPPEGKPPVSSSPKGLPLRTESEELQASTEKLFRLIDADNSGGIDMNEFKLACLLSISDESLVEKTFRKLDADNSGTLDMEEFKEGFTYLQEQISYSQKVEDRLRRESLALEQAGEQLEQELHRVEKTEDQLREEAAALEEAGEQLEEELLEKQEEAEMLANGLALVNQKNDEIANLKQQVADLTDELNSARDEIEMLEGGLAALRNRLPDDGNTLEPAPLTPSPRVD